MTQALARRFATRVTGGEVVGLCGALGVGKTAFARHLLVALGADPQEVTSPTFSVVQPYDRLDVPVLHVDLYRLANTTDLHSLGLCDPGYDQHVLLVEWADRCPQGLPPVDVWMHWSFAGQSARRVVLSPGDGVRGPCIDFASLVITPL